jgi:hypothetical protein
VKAKYILHEFTMGDVEDPEIYLAEPVYQWQQTKEGKWCMENAEDPTYHINPDYAGMGYRITITGLLSDKHATFWALKKA